MKPYPYILFFFLFSSFMAFSQSKAYDPSGLWTVATKDAKILIYKENNRYFGKIAVGNEPNRLDTLNPDPKLRTQKIVGSVILKGFDFDGKDKLSGGTIYDANNGKIYSCTMRLKNEKTLEVRGYIGISLFGRTEIWTR